MAFFRLRKAEAGRQRRGENWLCENWRQNAIMRRASPRLICDEKNCLLKASNGNFSQILIDTRTKIQSGLIKVKGSCSFSYIQKQ